MGATPHKAVTNRFPQAGANRTSEAPGVVFDPTTGDEGVETPPPNDFFQASLSPPVGGRLRSFRRDWHTNKCSNNVLNIITNSYVLPFISKPNLVRAPLIHSGYKALQKELALTACIQSLLSKNALERVENVKSLFLVPKPHRRWRPIIDLSRLNPLLLVDGNTRIHQAFSDSRRMGVVDRPSRHLPSHPHPPKLKEVPKVLPQVAGVPVHFPSLRTSHGPSGLYNDCKRGEADGPVKGNQTSPIPGRLADQGPVSGRSTSEHSDSGRSDSIVRVDNKSGEVRTKTNSGVLLRGLRIPSRFSPCKIHSREMAQTSGFDPTNQVKTCFDCKMFDVANWVACLNGKDGPAGTPSHEDLSVSPQGALEISSVVGHPPFLDRNHFSTPRMVAESHKRDERFRPSSQRPQYPTLYRCLKRRMGRSLRANLCKRFVVRQGKKTKHKCFRAEGGFSGPSKVQGPVSKPNSVSCHRQLNSGSLHKQTRRNSLGGDVHSPVEDYDLVPSLPDNTQSQTYSRVSECDGRAAVQVEPSSVNRMVTASAGVQTDLSQVVHSSCRSICHSTEPQSSTIRVSSPRPKCLGHRCSGLTQGSRLRRPSMLNTRYFRFRCKNLVVSASIRTRFV